MLNLLVNQADIVSYYLSHDLYSWNVSFLFYCFSTNLTDLLTNVFFNPFLSAIIAPINEPPLPRRKKCPELAYRHHEFISAPDSGVDRVDSANVTRARVSNLSSLELFLNFYI